MAIDDKQLCAQIGSARQYSVAPMTGYNVGAVVLTDQDQVFLGANLELQEVGLEQAIHAEQSVLIQVLHQGQYAKKIALARAPCCFCRQFMLESHAGKDIQILFPDANSIMLSDLTPNSFSPIDLGITALPPFGNKWSINDPHQLVHLEPEVRDLLSQRFINSHAPYTNSPGAVVLQTKTGNLYGGSYFENVAFNPSVAPVRSAIVELSNNKDELRSIVKAYCLKTKATNVDHSKSLNLLLSNLAHKVDLSIIEVYAT